MLSALLVFGIFFAGIFLLGLCGIIVEWVPGLIEWTQVSDDYEEDFSQETILSCEKVC